MLTRGDNAVENYELEIVRSHTYHLLEATRERLIECTLVLLTRPVYDFDVLLERTS